MSEQKLMHIKISNLKKKLDNQVGISEVIINNITAEIELIPHQITAILAPQGNSGLLKLLAELDTPDEGKIELSGFESGSEAKRIYIPQKPSSFPWLNVEENVRFALDRVTKDEGTKTKRIEYLLELLGLDGYEKHFPNSKSLGFRFRIALARALAWEPEIILLDDSLTGMDKQTKGEAYSLLNSISKKEKTLLLFSTNSITEAAILAKNLYVFGKKPLENCGQVNLSSSHTHDEKINKILGIITSSNLSGFTI